MNKVPDDKRVDELYEKLHGEHRPRGAWDREGRHEAQQIVYIEDSCRSVLAVIEKMRMRDIYDDSDDAPLPSDLIDELKSEIHFLKTVIGDKKFLRSLDFANR